MLTGGDAHAPYSYGHFYLTGVVDEMQPLLVLAQGQGSVLCNAAATAPSERLTQARRELSECCWTIAQKFWIIGNKLAPDHAGELWWERQMKRKRGMPRLYLASSGAEDMPVANTEQRLRSLLTTLEECQTFLLDRASDETARLLSLAILELRMELHKVTDSELKALCDMMAANELPPEPATPSTRQLPPYLKLIK
ncbi:hypothetical protein ACFFWD_12265 [Bradyrhizobium erythrophlei]|uniref:hypothetical protein n=1 Tax=Bradyrhizobium erythrophlei TaxID=1437360 RepID=UPI0035F0B472